MGTVQNKSTAVPVFGTGSKKYLDIGTLYFFQIVPRYRYGTLQKYIVIATGVAKSLMGRKFEKNFVTLFCWRASMT